MFTCDFYRYEHVHTYRMYLLQKTLLKENYAIDLDSCYLFTKKMLNVELNMILIVLIDSECIRHS